MHHETYFRLCSCYCQRAGGLGRVCRRFDMLISCFRCADRLFGRLSVAVHCSVPGKSAAGNDYASNPMVPGSLPSFGAYLPGLFPASELVKWACSLVIVSAAFPSRPQQVPCRLVSNPATNERRLAACSRFLLPLLLFVLHSTTKTAAVLFCLPRAIDRSLGGWDISNISPFPQHGLFGGRLQHVNPCPGAH